MTKFEATKVIHGLIEADMNMKNYATGQIADAVTKGETPDQYHNDLMAKYETNIAALTLAGMALTREV